MWYDDCSPSCAASQCHPPPPQQQQQQQQQQQTRPPPFVAVAAAVAPSTYGPPPNPMNMVQGQVLAQDTLKPSSEVYGEGAVYGSVQGPACTVSPFPSSTFSACYSPREHEEEQRQAYRPAPAVRAPPSQLSRPSQVVTYGQARSDNPASYMQANYESSAPAAAAPVVGMVQYAGMQQQQQQQQRSCQPPPVSYGQATASNLSLYASPGSTGNFSSSFTPQPRRSTQRQREAQVRNNNESLAFLSFATTPAVDFAPGL